MPSFQRIIDKLSNALDILDFSFLISGGTTLGIVYIYLTYFLNKQITFIPNGFIGICSILLMAYVFGLFSWSLGKYVRRKYFLKSSNKNSNQSNDISSFNELFKAINESCQNTIKYPFKDNTLNYTYMWNKIAQSRNEEIQERYNFINKYWVMQAIFEGLMGSALVGITLCLLTILHMIGSFKEECTTFDCFLKNWKSLFNAQHYYIILILTGFIILLLRSAVEARKNAEVQIKEVVIAYYLFFIESEIKKEE